MAQLRRLLLLLVLALTLTGCVDYDLGIRFDSQTHGTLTQTLHLSEQVAQLNQTSTQQWLQQFEQQANRRARVKRLDATTVQVTAPFYSAEDLSESFNALFDLGAARPNPLGDLPGSPRLTSHLDLRQTNWLVALRNQLSLDIDLTSLANFEANPAADWRVLNLAFHLVTPWGLQPAEEATIAGQDAVWQLQPGRVNHIEAVFWIPSWIGIGAVAIALTMTLSYLIKHGKPTRS